MTMTNIVEDYSPQCFFTAEEIRVILRVLDSVMDSAGFIPEKGTFSLSTHCRGSEKHFTGFSNVITFNLEKGRAEFPCFGTLSSSDMEVEFAQEMILAHESEELYKNRITTLDHNTMPFLGIKAKDYEIFCMFFTEKNLYPAQIAIYTAIAKTILLLRAEDKVLRESCKKLLEKTITTYRWTMIYVDYIEKVVFEELGVSTVA